MWYYIGAKLQSVFFLAQFARSLQEQRTVVRRPEFWAPQHLSLQRNHFVSSPERSFYDLSETDFKFLT